MTRLEPAKLLAIDVVRLAAYGLRARPLRVVLSALGIAIGIARCGREIRPALRFVDSNQVEHDPVTRRDWPFELAVDYVVKIEMSMATALGVPDGLRAIGHDVHIRTRIVEGV